MLVSLPPRVLINKQLKIYFLFKYAGYMLTISVGPHFYYADSSTL